MRISYEWLGDYVDTSGITPQVLVASYSYELPFGKGKAFGADWNGGLNAIAGGWPPVAEP